MPEQNNPLMNLISDDAAALDKEKIYNFLKPYISFDKDTKEIVFSSEFVTLKDNLKKIEIVLLSSKVKSLLFNDEEEGFLPKELITLEIMPEGSIKSSLKKLADHNRIKKNNNGKYYLPNYHVNNITNKISSKK